MVSSILTNNGAMTALQSLKATQKNLLDTQNRISTGLKVSTAKDNAATWAVATSMRSDIANFKQVSENLSISSSIVTTAENATTSIAGLLEQIKSKVTSAQTAAVDPKLVQLDIDQLREQISGIVESAAFKGVNLISGDGLQKVLSSVNTVDGVSKASYIDVKNQNLAVASNGGLADLMDVSVVSKADQLLTNDTDAEKATAYTFSGPATAAGNVTFTYTDKDGQSQSIVTGLTGSETAAQLGAALSANTQFASKGFVVSDDGAGVVTVKVADRTQNLSFGNSAFTSTAAGATVSGNVINSVSLTFQNEQPLKLGDTFSFDYNVSGTDRTAKLQVSEQTSGTLLGQDSDGNNIYAVNSAVVSDYSVTGVQIADEFRAALDAAGGTEIAIGAAGASALGLNATGSATLTISTASGTDTLGDFNFPTTDYDTLLGKISSAINTVTAAGAAFGSAGKRIDIQKDFMDKLVDTLTSGVGALVDADMSEEAARLQALQVQEQLGTQALSIANQAPQSILSLFRG